MKIFTKEEFYKLPKDKQTGCIIFDNGSKLWCKEGKRHRDDGPAFEGNGTKIWYKNDNKHRIDGPA